MKKLMKINFLLALALLVFTSCAVDDDAAVIPTGTKITASLDKTGEIFMTPSAGSEVTVNVVLSEAVDTDSQFVYTLNGTEQTVGLNAGETTAPIAISNTIGNIIDIELVKASTLYNPNVILGTQTTVKFVSLPAASSTDITVMMTNSANSGSLWLGLSQFSADGSTWVADYEGSLNGNNPRISSLPLNGVGAFATIPNSVDIAPNVMAINLYPQVTMSQDLTNYNIYVIMPDSSVQSFSGSIPATAAVDNAVVKVEIADDANSPGNRTYTFSEF